MNAFGIIRLNGRTAGGRPPLAISTVCALAEYNNVDNAWNVVPSSGEFNNNNKNNGNYVVRPAAACDDEAKLGWIEAYHECCRKKKGNPDCLAFRMNYEEELHRLINEIYSGEYLPSPGVSFVVTKPCPREIITSQFRDRIVQTWIALRVEPLFEERFRAQGDVSHNCRKGLGLQSAVADLRVKMDTAWHTYGRNAYVGKIDVRGFFMSIDTARLLSLATAFISERYKGGDKELLLRLVELSITHGPQHGAKKKSPQWMYDLVPPRKRMEFSPKGKGMAAGNLNSQLMANFYMSHVVEKLIESCARNGCSPPVEFVDDFALVGPRDGVLAVIREAKEIFSSFGLELHPDKIYIQPVSHGVKFVGSVIKPHRTYTANRTIDGLRRCIIRVNGICRSVINGDTSDSTLLALRSGISSLNSYLGATRRSASVNIRARLFAKFGDCLLRVCYTKGAYLSVHIKNEFNFKLLTLQKELQYGLELHHRSPRQSVARSLRRRMAIHRQLQR